MSVSVCVRERERERARARERRARERRERESKREEREERKRERKIVKNSSTHSNHKQLTLVELLRALAQRVLLLERVQAPLARVPVRRVVLVCRLPLRHGES
jgi:hypothetical protein